MKTELNIDEHSESDTPVSMTAMKIKKKKPSPGELLAEVKGQPAVRTYEFDDYVEVIHEMQSKGFSYAKIAEFLTEKLGYAITRGQVYRAYQLWAQVQEEEQRQKEEAEHYEAMWRAQHGEAPDDMEPEDEAAKAAQVAETNAAVDVLKYVREKHPEYSLGCSHVHLFQRVIAFLDFDARNEFEAAEADKRREAAQKPDHASGKSN